MYRRAILTKASENVYFVVVLRYSGLATRVKHPRTHFTLETIEKTISVRTSSTVEYNVQCNAQEFGEYRLIGLFSDWLLQVT